MHTYSLSSLFLCTTLVLGCFGCEEEGIPPTSPQVLSASLVCSQQGAEYYLESFSMVVEDLNGSETLLDPSVEVLSVAIPLNSTPLLSAKGKANQAAEETSMMDEVEEAEEAEEVDEAEEAEETEENPMNMPEVEQDSCTFESCKMRYTWDIQDSSESGPILCGEDGLALVAQVRIMDESGRLQQEITVNSEPQ